MQVINFYSVSIFLSYVKLRIDATNVGLQSVSTFGVLPGSNKLRTNQSKTFGFSPNNGLIPDSGVSKTNQPLQYNDLSTTRISAVNKPVKNEIDNLATTFYDNPGKPNTVSFRLYNATASIFNSMLDIWLVNEEKLVEGAKSVGIPEDIVLAVNGSMTQLFAFQRNNNGIKIDNLSNLFYYMFDIKHMSEKDTDINVIKDKLMNFSSKIQCYDCLLNRVSESVNSGLENLKNILNELKIDNYNLSYIIVNVVLMKSMMLINKSNGEHLNKMINALSTDYFNKVKADQYEIQRSLIDKNHVELIGNVMPIIFGVLYNHIELLTKLKEHTINEEDENQIKYLNTFFSDTMNIFINRYFIFGYEIKNKISDLKSVKQLLQMLNPKDMDPRKTQESNKNMITPQFLELTEMAIAEILSLVGKSNAEEWKQNNIFKCDYEQNEDKDYYIELLTNNADLLYSLLEEFENSFLNGIEYKKKQ
ncbi:uncharacterized protein LOC112603398 [Melanaphis sacchari]|uniref:uncharacterized protein LOC112603398 n=1 Tax=Melanaphis sacchari TaxID=742174 RepID=UPI000DC15095|nr:uncharacterized protein LOC112603398 [Melanaphis sacchari]